MIAQIETSAGPVSIHDTQEAAEREAAALRRDGCVASVNRRTIKVGRHTVLMWFVG